MPAAGAWWLRSAVAGSPPPYVAAPQACSRAQGSWGQAAGSSPVGTVGAQGTGQPGSTPGPSGHQVVLELFSEVAASTARPSLNTDPALIS